MAALETVYATHNFEAENEDEITIKAGEPVIVLEKDEKYQDGWWQGRNVRGQIGLFPVNYTSPRVPANQSLESKIDSLEYAISNMQVGVEVKPTPTPGKKTGSVSKSNMQKAVSATLSMPQLQGTPPDDWSVDQVSLWLDAMGFGDLCAHFKGQDITGDVLLELSIESLKELDIKTFGKRFKLHNAIQALQREISRREQISDAKSEQEAIPPRTSTDSRHTNRSIHSVRPNRAPTLPHSANNSPPSLSSAGSSSPRYAFSDIGANNGYGSKVSSSEKRSNHLPLKENTVYGSQSTQMDSLGNNNNNNDDFSSRYRAQDKMINSRPSNVSDKYQCDEVLSSIVTDPQSNRTSARYSLFRGSFLRSTNKTTASYDPQEPINRIARSMTVASAQVIPDMEGWLHKQGDKYKTWNRRWFVLKGSNLFYFKNPKELRVRGIINLAGYRFSSDASIHPGKYCFRAEHERERTFCFYTDSKENMKQWMRALMKATISRDYKAPVLSSSTVPTVSLDVARRMNPRPPSILLESKDDSARLEVSQDTRSFSLTYGNRPAPTMRLSRSESVSSRVNGYYSDNESIRHPHDVGGSGGGMRPAPSHIPFTHPSQAASTNPQLNTLYDIPDEEDEDLIDPERGEIPQYVPPSPQVAEFDNSQTFDYVKWVNEHILQPVQSLGELRSGESIIELLERLSGKTVRRSVITSGGSSSMRMLDDIVAAFRFMGREGVTVDGSYTIKDIFNGDESKVKLMLDAIRQRWPEAVAPSSPPASAKSNAKQRNRLTFGEDDNVLYQPEHIEN